MNTCKYDLYTCIPYRFFDVIYKVKNFFLIKVSPGLQVSRIDH